MSQITCLKLPEQRTKPSSSAAVTTKTHVSGSGFSGNTRSLLGEGGIEADTPYASVHSCPAPRGDIWTKFLSLNPARGIRLSVDGLHYDAGLP